MIKSLLIGVSSNGSDDSPYSWSEKPFHPYSNGFKNMAVCTVKNSTKLNRNLVSKFKINCVIKIFSYAIFCMN